MIEDKTAEIVSFLEKNKFQVAITPHQVVFKKGRKITFDVDAKQLSILKNVPWKVKKTYAFSTINNFELVTKEQFADATPFADGNKEYIRVIKMNFDSGKSMRMFNFIDRDPDGEQKLEVLMELLRRIIV